MTLNLYVRDYRGIERADIALDPICLVAGQNEAGKSSLAEAARAVLAGVPIPVAGVAKKDARLLVRDGAEDGSASAADGTGRVDVLWPKAEVNTDNAGETWCSPIAVGLTHLFDLDAKERARVLGRYVESEPNEKDLAAAMADIGYAKTAIEPTWQALRNGWDETWKKAKEHTTKLKGQWEGVTGEKYGAKKAETWTPEGHPGTGATREALAADLERAQAAVKAAVGAAAVSVADVERLRAEAGAAIEDPAPLRAGLEEAKASLAATEQERLALPAEGTGANTLCNCPACGAELVVEALWKGPTVLKLHDKEAAEQAASKAVRKRRAELDGRVANLKGQIDTLLPKLERIERETARAKIARERLAQIGEPGPDNAAQVAEAEQAEASARGVLAAFDAKANAERLQASIVKHGALAALLAPDGLRRRKLAAGLASFNGRLAGLCAIAKWPAVRLDEDLKPHYGTRPVWAASGSGQWRARAVVQIAMAQLDGSAAVVIDEADILDFRGRNALFALLKSAGVKALICMTVNKPALVPDLLEAGLGQSVWIESGIAEAIKQQEGALA